MEAFRLFLIRLLQVLWFLLALGILVSIIVEHTFVYSFGFGLVFGIPLIVVQYLIFARLNPWELFDGRIKQNLESRGHAND